MVHRLQFQRPGQEHGKVRYVVFNGGTPKYVAAIEDVVAKGYEGIVFSSGARSGANSPRPAYAERSARSAG